MLERLAGNVPCPLRDDKGMSGKQVSCSIFRFKSMSSLFLFVQ